MKTHKSKNWQKIREITQNLKIFYNHFHYPYSRSQRVGNGIQVNDANKCTYGWEVDACGNQICTKGPGEVCGGKGQRYGVCGEGM